METKNLDNKSERYINEDGKIGVLVSGDYGAGFSTWNSEYYEFLCTDKTLVEMCINDKKEDDVGAYLESKGIDCFLDGWSDCRVEFVSKKTSFRIEEHDGYESIYIISEDSSIITA